MKKYIIFILLLFFTIAKASDKKIYEAYKNAKQYNDYSSEMNFEPSDKVTLKQFNKWLEKNGELISYNASTQTKFDIGEEIGLGLASFFSDGNSYQLEIVKNTELIAIESKTIFMYGCSHDFVVKVNFLKKSNVKRYFSYIQQQIELQKQQNYESSLKQALVFGIGLKLLWEGTKWVAKTAYDNGLLSNNNSYYSSSDNSSSSSNNFVNSSSQKREIEIIIKREDKKCCEYIENSICFDIYIDDKKQNYDVYTISQDKNGDWTTNCNGTIFCDKTSNDNALKNYFYYKFGKNNNDNIIITK